MKSHKSKSSINELKNRAGGGERGMLDSERTRTRRERTFVGSECAVCEEPLEHTLRGERILQFSCGHVCHGACFYEYMKEFDSHYCPTCNAPLGLDTSRGGNVLDIGRMPHPHVFSGILLTGTSHTEKISDMVRTASVQDRTTAATPTPSNWDNQTIRPPSSDSQGRHYEQDRSQSRHGGREIAAGYRDPRRDTHQTNNTHNTQNTRMTRESHNTQISHGTHRTQDSHDIYAQNRSHKRMDSEATGHNSNGYQETVLSGPRRAHDYDLQQMETSLPSPRHSQSKNPVPPPVVSVRSEFPTINRAKIQQTLTCLVTIEVPDNKWRPDPEDLRPPPVPAIPEDDVYERPPSPAKSIPRFYPYESPEVLAEMTENLRGRVENWHGLDFSRFGKLRLYGTIRVGKDKIQWQELECYLFAEMLICVKEKKGAPLQQWADEGNGRRNTRCTLKGSILIKKHLNGVTQTSASEQIGMTQKITSSNLRAGEENILTLSLSVAELPQFHLQFENLNQLKLWKQALLDINAVEISPDRHGDYERDYDDVEDDDYRRSHGTTKRGSSLNSSVYGAGRTAMSTATAPTEYTNHRSLTLNASPHVPIDIVVVIPISSSMQGVKMSLVRDALNYLVHNLGARDRMGLVTFGSSGGGVPLVGMTGKAWSGWGNIFQQIRPVGQKLHRADVVEGANTAMDLLMQRKSCNPISTILLISDASGSDGESVDFVVSRAEAAKYVYPEICYRCETTLLTSKQNSNPLLRPRPNPHAHLHARALHTHQRALHLRQRLDAAPRMSRRLSRVPAIHLPRFRQVKTPSPRRLTSQIRKDLRRPGYNQTCDRQRCGGSAW